MITDSEQRLSALLEILEDETRAGEERLAGAELPELSVDLRTLLGQMTALKNEIRKETLEVQETRAALAARLDEVGQGLVGIGALEARLKAATDSVAQTEQTRRADLLIDLYERQTAAIRAARALAEPRRFLFWTRRDPAARSLVEGLEMTLENLEAQLRQLGIERIDAVGKAFDPSRMEALEVVAEEDAPEGYVVSEIRAGFTRRGSVYRFAQVTVKGKNDNE